jgi:hypothetical protein
MQRENEWKKCGCFVNWYDLNINVVKKNIASEVKVAKLYY